MKILNVKGGYDFLPKEQKIRNYINNTFKEVFEEFGYNPIETPILCYYDILSDKYDEENDILKEIYKLTDQGDRKLGLRYDLTVPFAKLIALNKNQITMPFKRYEIAKAFRDGPVKVGRDREFTQCDADVVGISGQLIEAELLSLYKEAFDRLDIDIIIKYNSRSLMNGLIIENGIEENIISEVTTIIDKLEKVTKEEFKELLSSLGLASKQIKGLITDLNLSLMDLNKKYFNTQNEILQKGLKEINDLTEYLDKMNLLDTCEFSPSLARGQNYYTGNVFEVYSKEKIVTCSIGGGGRYDKMITNFINDGNEYPAVGISFGLTSIYTILKDKPMFSEEALLDFYIIPIGTNIESLNIANQIRKQGYKVELEMQNKKLKKSLDFANKEKIRYVIIVGEDEIKNNKLKIKDMFNRKEYELAPKDIDNIKNIIKE